MPHSQNQDNSADKSASRNFDSTKELVLDEYRKHDKNYKAAMLFEVISVATKNIIRNGEMYDFKKYLQFIIGILSYEEKENPKKLKEIIQNATKIGNFIILACEYNRSDILSYLMDKNNQSYARCCQPGDEDNANHNAFYYAIRDENIDFLEVLLYKWPGYVNSEEMYQALAVAYNETNLKRMIFSNKLILFITERLIDYNFYTDDKEDTKITFSLSDIKERAELLIENIRLFIAEYSNTDELNSILFVRSKFITYNINILKQQMKATYSKILWEEIEFCVLMFISAKEHSKVKNMNLYKFLMPKSKLLNYLDLFANILENEMKNISDENLDSLKNYPRESRVKMIPKILKSNPKIREFFEDYQRLKDVYALYLINHSIQILIQSYSDLTYRQAVIKRALHVISETMKNNWESPNMTRSLSLLLLTSLPSRTRQIIVNFHNSSLIHTQTRKLGKGNPNDPHEEVIFRVIKDDLMMIKWMAQTILHVTLIHYITVMLETILEMKTPEDLTNYINSLDLNFNQKWFEEYKVEQTWNFDTLTSEFNNLVEPDSDLETSVCDYLDGRAEVIGINATERFVHVDNLIYFQNLCIHINKATINSHMFQKIKIEGKFALANKLDETELYVGPTSICSYILSAVYSVSSRLIWSKYERMMSLVVRIFVVIGHGLQSYEWLEILNSQVWSKRYSVALNLDDNMNSTQEKKELSTQVLNDYNSKVEILKNIFGDHKSGESIEKFKSLSTQLSVEMLTLELMSILDAAKNLVDNYTLLDNPAPITVGKFLYRYLAHSLLVFQIFDPATVIFLNSKKLCVKGDEIKDKKIGRIFQNNIKELKLRHSRHLSCIINQNEMFYAIEQGDIKKLEYTINKGADINGLDYRGYSSLHYAAKGGNLIVFRLVINLKIKNNFRNVNGESPLHIAVRYRQIEIVKWLINDLGNPEVEDFSKTSPLYLAVLCNYKEIVKVLLPHNYKTPHIDLIQTAVLHNCKDVLEILLEHSNKEIHFFETKDGQTPLLIAAKNGFEEMTQYLIKVKKADVNYCSDGVTTPLFEAALYGHLGTVKILFSHKADIHFSNKNQLTALHAAAQYGHDKVVQFLLENGANVHKFDISNWTPLHLAAENGHLEVVKLLIKYKSEINAATSMLDTPLILAAQKGHCKVAQYLLENKAVDLDQCGTLNSVVHFAAIHGNLELISYPLRRKGQVLKRNGKYHSPLYLAAMNGRLEVVKFLYERGANCVNSATDTGYNPLHAAVHKNHPEIVEFFISRNVDLDTKTKESSCPISIACHQGFYEIVKLLGEGGCDLNIKNALGLTPLHLALLKNHLKVVEYLLSKYVDIMALTKHKKLPIHTAIENSQFNVIATFINRNKDLVNAVDDFNATPLYIACRWNCTELIQLLINNGANIIYNDMHCMDPAVRSGCKDVIDVLFKSGVNVHGVLPYGVPFLHRAVEFEQLDIVKMLVAKKVDINAFSTARETALMCAAYFNFTDIVDYLLKNKADPHLRNEDNLSALDIAIIRNSFDAFYILVELFQVKVVNEISTKLKPLHDAAYYGRETMVRFLIKKGFDVNGRYLNGFTSLHAAARGNRRVIVKILLENGAHYDSENAENKKPIHLTEDELTVSLLEIIDNLFTYIKKGDYNGCLDCLRRKVLVNAKSSTSLTPLHYACQNGFSDIVKLLLHFNADINMKADYGTPLVYAVLFDRYEIVKILLKHGAVYNVTTNFGGKSLANLSQNLDIIHLLELIDKVFDAIIKCDITIVDEIKKIKDLDILQCILSAHNNDNKQLYLEAENSKFPDDKFFEIYAHEAYLFVEKVHIE